MAPFGGTGGPRVAAIHTAGRGVQTGCSSCADQPYYLIFFYPLSPIFSNLACFFNAPPHFISTTVTHLHVLED